MLTLRPFSRRIGAGGLCKYPATVTFISHRGLDAPVLAQMLDSLVRVSRREKENHFVHISIQQHKFCCQTPTRTTPAAAPQPQADEEMRVGSHWFPSLPFQQVQVLFDSALARLCIFPSRYLYAIGLPPVFSLRWNLPPT